MRKFSDPNEVSGGILNTVPLNDAVCDGDLNAVKFLLSEGAIPDGMDETAITPLMEASREGFNEIVQVLIDAGADVNRMGFIQRFYPLDFAYWIKSDKKTIELLRNTGALKVDSDVNWESLEGWPIIFHVSRNYAAVYPRSFERKIDGENFDFWLGQIRKESDFLYLFSAGLYRFGKNLDFGMIVPAEWSLLNNYIKQKTIFSFPLDFMERMASRAKGRSDISEGYLVMPSDPDFSDLTWPLGVKGMIAVNHLWKEDKNLSESGCSSEEVKIFTFAPITLKSFNSSETALIEMANKLKLAKSKKLALPYYWKDRL